MRQAKSVNKKRSVKLNKLNNLNRVAGCLGENNLIYKIKQKINQTEISPNVWKQFSGNLGK